MTPAPSPDATPAVRHATGAAGVAFVRDGTWDAGIRGGMLHEYPSLPRTLDRHDVVIDVGCHTGGFSALAAARGALVVAFEANRENHALAVMNLAAFDAVTVHFAAVWRSDLDAPTSLLFTPNVNAANTGGGSVLFASEDDHWSTIPDPDAVASSAVLSTHAVGTVALDDVLVAAGHVRFLKLDAEGSEFPILLTSRRLDLVDAVAGEYHELTGAEMDAIHPSARVGDTPYDRATLRGALEGAGFAVELRPGPDARRGLFTGRRR